MAIKPRKIWEKGTPLNAAWDVWATEENYKKLEENHEIDFSKSSENISFADGLRQLSPGVLKFDKLQKDKSAAISKMKQDLIEWLTEEELFALGFPVLPSAERTPRLISSEFWINAKIDWDGEIASNEVLKFQKIKVVGPEDFSEINLKPKIGRKSYKPLVYEAIAEILIKHPDFEKNTHKEKAILIRNYFELDHPEIDPYGPGLGDDAIRKMVNSYFKNPNNL